MPGTCYVSWLIINCVLKTFVINKQVIHKILTLRMCVRDLPMDSTPTVSLTDPRSLRGTLTTV